MEALKDVSSALAETVARASKSVVRVEARRRLPASGIVWSSDGVIVTAHHVVQREGNIQIGLDEGKTVSAELVGRDATTDLAVLRADVSGIEVPDWANVEDLRVGHLVLALGRPGQRVMATLGIVSALGERWQTPAGGELEPYLQTDVVMYPGFSGGLLVSGTGVGLGLNTSGLLRGVSLTVPHGSLDQVVRALLEHGRVRRGYLGVSVQPVRLPVLLAEKLDQETGVMLVAVEPDTPADKGGLVLGDTIVAFDGERVRHMDDLLALLSGERIGSDVPVRVVRGGELKDLQILIGVRE
ncbi:MAG: PDZ domain-containing protein [Anaerolineales bacterium]|nr:PDZ domain-containing protein [Anaerolineales bacterium]